MDYLIIFIVSFSLGYFLPSSSEEFLLYMFSSVVGWLLYDVIGKKKKTIDT